MPFAIELPSPPMVVTHRSCRSTGWRMSQTRPSRMSAAKVVGTWSAARCGPNEPRTVTMSRAATR